MPGTQSIGTPALWIGFTVVVAALLAVDLGLMSRDPKPMTKRAAALWTVAWVSLAAAFGAGIYFFAAGEHGSRVALEFTTAYLIEYSLSIDNLFVFLLLFHAFAVPAAYQHRVLFWGIFGAVILRGIFIFVGSALLASFHPLIYIFGAFLVFTGLKLLFEKEESEDDVKDSATLRLARRFIPVSDSYDGHHFFTIVNGARRATPLLLVLVSVELSDVVFALDSIPAVFGVSTDAFIVYTSNIFAILGLRSLYFLIAGALWGLRFLKPALGLVLGFVGLKMLLPLVPELARHVSTASMFAAENDDHWHVSIGWSLAVIGGLLGAGIALSLLFPGKDEADRQAALEVETDLREALHPSKTE